MAPALSPDGESFAYVKEIGGQRDVFLQRVGGDEPGEPTAGCKADDDEPAFSPDGRRIAYRSECAGGGIFVMGATGESARKVTDKGYNPAWSPGRQGARDRGREAPQPVLPDHDEPALGGEDRDRRAAASPRPDAVQPSWSPDGRRIAYWGLDDATSARDLFTVRPTHRSRIPPPPCVSSRTPTSTGARGGPGTAGPSSSRAPAAGR